ncbi:hypothetical protein Peur_002711 [Populus x canadensis]
MTSLSSPGVEGGKVASSLLATTSIVKLSSSIMKKKMLFEAVSFLLLISILRFTIEVGLSKQAATSLVLSASPSWMLDIAPGDPLWTYIAKIGPILSCNIIGMAAEHRTITSSIFGGLRKSDEFVLVRQAILLPVLGLPFLAVRCFLLGQNDHVPAVSDKLIA